MCGKFSFHSPDWNEVSDTTKDLISKLLEVDPKKRLNSEQALLHPFFQTVQSEQRYFSKPFNAQQKFRVAVHTIIASIRIVNLYQQRHPPKVGTAIQNPYSIRQIR